MPTLRIRRPNNALVAKRIWPSLSRAALQKLQALTQELLLSVSAGDLIYLDHGWYVTHTGLLHIALRNRCHGIQVAPAAEFCNPTGSRWAFKATVFKSPRCKGFVGYGDADPSNVSPQVRGAEMRVAETRAVNRALRKAYGIGICSAEELGSFSGPRPPAAQMKNPGPKTEPVNGNRHHPLRDRLCLLIRQHRLDPALVKAYAADYCDVAELRLASRDQVAGFIKHLAEYAQNDREGLLCQLNSYEPKPASGALVESANDNTADEPEKAAGAA
jgi:hypothetical protein